MSLTRAIKKQSQATTKVRETRLGRMALVLLLLGLEACAAPEQSFATRPTSSPRPNVVFMMAFFGVDEVGRPLKDVADHVVVMVVSRQLGRLSGSVGGRSETSFAMHCITFVRDTKLL